MDAGGLGGIRAGARRARDPYQGEETGRRFDDDVLLHPGKFPPLE